MSVHSVPLGGGRADEAGSPKRTMVGLKVAVVLFVALAVAAPLGGRPASADSISNVQSQLSAMQAQVAAATGHIHQLTTDYDQAELAAASLAKEVGSDQQAVGQLTAEMGSSKKVLQNELILGYVGAYSGTPGGSGGGTPVGTDDPAVREGYVAIASGTLRDALDSYTASRVELTSSQAGLERALAAAQASVAAAAQARQAAVSTAAAQQAKIDQLQSKLSSLQQAAATAASQPASQGLPVNGGLVDLVNSELSAPATVPSSSRPSVASPSTTDTVSSSPVPVAAPTTPDPPTSAATTVPATAPTTVPAASGSGGSSGVWLELRTCESGDNYRENTGNGYYGAYQFSQSTWSGLGYSGRPDQAPPATQDAAAQKLQSESGWGAWPACSAALGLR